MKKIIVVSIIALFIVVGFQPAFAVEDKSSIESLTIYNENENSITMSRGVYENTNCFVIGSVGEAFNLVSSGYGSIVFGFKNDDRNEDKPSGGWIYTNGDNGKWIYWSRLKGKFFGDIRSYGIRHWWTGEYLTLYVGVDGFRGLAVGGFPWRETEPSVAHCWFIGYAELVKIRTAYVYKTILR